MTAWDVASEIAFDPSQSPGNAITALEYLLTHRPPPLIEEQHDEPMSDEDVEEITRERGSDA